MILLAILGVLFNGAAVLRLQQGDSLNEKVISLHLMEDVLGWVAVLIGSIVIYFFNWTIIDPILSILITCYIVFNVYKNLRYALTILMQAVPMAIKPSAIQEMLVKIPEIAEVHKLHIWSLDDQYNVLTTHIVLEQPLDFDKLAALKKKIRHDLLHENIHHVTLEFEQKGEDRGKVECSH